MREGVRRREDFGRGLGSPVAVHPTALRAGGCRVCLAALPRVQEVSACEASLGVRSQGCLLVVEASLEPFQTHLEAFLCHLLWVTLTWQGGWTR